MANEVVLVQALHDNDNRAGALVVEAGVERVVVELANPAPLGGGVDVEALIGSSMTMRSAPRPSSDPAPPEARR